MNCQDLEQWLELTWERRKRPEVDFAPEAWRTHLERCPSCRGLVEANQRLFEGFALEIPAPSPDFANRVLARLTVGEAQTENTSRTEDVAGELVSARHRMSSSIGSEPSWLRRHSMIWLSVAAAALLAAFTVLWNARDDSPERVAVHSPIGANNSSGIAQNDAAADAEEALWDPSTQMQSVAMFLLSPPDLKTMVALVNRSVLDLLGDPAERVRQLPGGLRQVALSVNVTIDLLRQALPGGPEAAPADSSANEGDGAGAGEVPPALEAPDPNAA